jgi:hypothetical protein
MASKVEHLEKRIESILKNREDELNALRNEVDSDRQKAEAASKAIEAATAANDIDKYRAAKAEKALADDLTALHEARTRMLQGKELVSEEEYTSVRDAVMDEVSAILAGNKEKAAGLLTELERIAESDRAVISRANAALLKWQDTIFRDPNLRRHDGAIIAPRQVRFEVSPVITLSDHIRERHDGQQITGRRE